MPGIDQKKGSQKLGGDFGRPMPGPFSPGPEVTCICPVCGYEIPSVLGQPCTRIRCPRCGGYMTEKVGEWIRK